MSTVFLKNYNQNQISNMSIHSNIKSVIISDIELKNRIKELAANISHDYQDSKEIVMICILQGAFLFMADLVREIDTVPVIVDFMSVSSYGNETKTSGTVKILLDLKSGIEGKDIIIVEDIIDSGLTLQYLVKYLKNKGPKSLKICVLLNKMISTTDVAIDYQGFEISKDAFVVGYGLDYSGHYRNINYVGELDGKVYAKKE